MIEKILALIGLILSLYSLYVERRYAKKPFRPICDISENISCTKAFSSKYGKHFNIPNPIYGIAFYSSLFLFQEYLLYLTALGVAISLYLAYISYIRQKNFCVICSLTYVINILLFIAAYLR
ncbi:vitamin K epoxide reductase family protein [Candidatus Woesearchaeota archaeon]|nr:vitamin K epoxide reductase family protein [Candidatus Woesearchaeota archaeon]